VWVWVWLWVWVWVWVWVRHTGGAENVALKYNVSLFQIPKVYRQRGALRPKIGMF